MDAVERLTAVQDIKQVKAKYFWGLDHKDWDLWRREVWAADGRLEVPEVGEVHEPLEVLIAAVSSQVADQVSVHHGHQPIFEFVSDTEANVIWAMEDRLFRTKEHPLHDGSMLLHGFGHYHETYVKLSKGWRLKSSRLTRLRLEMTKVFGQPGDKG